MGVVYKARDPQIGRIVAIKTILLFRCESAEQEEWRVRFLEEARSAGGLFHSGIVTLFDVGCDPDGTPFVVMEYVDGKPLNQLLVDNQGRLPLVPALRLAQEIAEALDFAHGLGVIHGNIKPENIFVTPEGGVKIADFGIALLDYGHLARGWSSRGEPWFLIPLNNWKEKGRIRAPIFFRSA